MDKMVIIVAVAFIVIGFVAGYYLLGGSGGLEFKDGYAVATAMGGGAFMTIHNGYNYRVCLVKAEAPDLPGAKVELHKTTVDERGVARMEPVEKICAGPGEDLVLKHGGYHVMIMNADIEPGSTLRLVLYFDNGDTLTVELPVKRMGGQ